ncbi:MAG TPA: ATP-dependent DNA helicase, partial [Streptosporangiaceae bacterium]|nr:ATP-dependent DNA helicase [Streptosporangiaceae bacterium]
GECDLPDVAALLAVAVAGIGGAERPGQLAMARAVHHSIETGEHLAVQAGTGTGKSLAYLVPAVRHAVAQHATVVVSTATIALQRQLIDRDLPRLAAALEPALRRAPVFAMLKGRRHYLCMQRVRTGAPDDPADTLFDARGGSPTGRQVQRLHTWAATTSTGDRDELVPGVAEQAWRQVSVTARECLGAQRCPFGTQCFAELARAQAGQADVVVTNHALLAIDALEDFDVLPEHDVVIIDEAHDLVDRVTSVASAELSAAAVEAAARRCSALLEENAVSRLREAGKAAAGVLAEVPAGRLDVLGEPLAASLAAVRDAAAGCASELRSSARKTDEDPQQHAARRAALAPLDELQAAADRMLSGFGADVAARPDVVWMERPRADEPSAPPALPPRALPPRALPPSMPPALRPPTLRVAPLTVAGLLAARLFSRRAVTLTSATLALGGSFEPLARQWGLSRSDAAQAAGPRAAAAGAAAAAVSVAGGISGTAELCHAAEEPGERPPPAWSGLDVGSPFDHRRHGILYIARRLPPPGRDGLPQPYLDELCELISAAGGRTLGLFSSMRAARQAAAQLRDRAGLPLLCQGDDATSQLISRFAADEVSCLFGTLSLWQGVDVPGRSLQLVVIDRIPFPRPDDPLASARQRAVAARGGDGFMAVAAAHAALLLAQGAGRLLRTTTDRGVVAVLDPRLATARYGSYLRASLPPLWTTTDPEVVRGALRRLAASPLPPQVATVTAR